MLVGRELDLTEHRAMRESRPSEPFLRSILWPSVDDYAVRPCLVRNGEHARQELPSGSGPGHVLFTDQSRHMTCKKQFA
eukprot:11935656-Heterocapsa_arctica.AAC.1